MCLRIPFSSHIDKIRTVEDALDTLDEAIVKETLYVSLRDLFGNVGQSVQIDLLQLFLNGSFFLRIPHSALAVVTAVLSTITSMNGKKCRIEVLKIAPSLIDLASEPFDINTFNP